MPVSTAKLFSIAKYILCMQVVAKMPHSRICTKNYLFKYNSFNVKIYTGS